MIAPLRRILPPFVAILLVSWLSAPLAPQKAEAAETNTTTTVSVGVLGMAGGAVRAMEAYEAELSVSVKRLTPAQFARPALPDLSGLDLLLVSFASGDHKEQYKQAVGAALIKNPELKVFCIGPPPIFKQWAEWLGPGVVRYDKKMAGYYGLSKQSMRDMLQYTLVTHFGRAGEITPPETKNLVRIYHPDYGEFDSIEDFLQRATREGWDVATAPRVALGSWRHHVVFHQPQVIHAIMRELEERGILTVCLVADDPDFRERLETFAPDVVVMTSHTRESVDFWKKLNVPRIHALWFTEESIAEWRESNQPGMPKGGLVHQLVGSELKGATETLTSGGTESGNNSGEEIIPIPDRIRRIAGRVESWINLARTPNKDKKIAVVTYDREVDKSTLMSCPPKNLNAPKSMIRFLAGMEDAGYSTANLPANERELLARLMDHGRQLGTWEPGPLDALARSGKAVLIPADKYQTWFEEKIPASRRQELITHWGTPPGKIMVWEFSGKKYLVIPRLDLGNLVLLTQPPKGETLTATASQDSDTSLYPPTHHYLATYFWMQEEFGADAVIHFGAHGSEWLFPGKQAFLSKYDWGDILIGDMPNINPWLSSNISELVPAKRKAMAVTIDFMPPPLMQAGLSDDLLNLESAITKYLALPEGALKEKFATTITDQVRKSDLDLRWLPGPDGGRDRDLSVRLEKIKSSLGLSLNEQEIERILVYLHNLKNEHVPAGMHTLGEAPDEALVMPYLVHCMGDRFMKALGGILSGGKDDAEALKRKTLDILDMTLHKGFTPAEAVQAAGGSLDQGRLPAPVEEGLATAGHIYQGMMDPSQEIGSILAALDGKFIPPGPSGSPERNPAVLPTGRNMVVLNPQELPSRESWELGTRLMKQYLDKEHERTGRYPRKIAFSLIPYTTYADYGLIESQVLYLMGVRPVWDAKNRVRDVELIPSKELGRPRIDVFLSARSVYRDELPSMMRLLDKAVRLAAAHKEDDNLVYRNSQALRQKLEGQGMSPDKARTLSQARMFGTEVDEIQDSHNWFFYLSERTGEWDSRQDLLDVYLKNSKHVYTQGLWGENAPEAFDAAINGTETIFRSWYDNRDFVLGNKFAWWVGGTLSMAVKAISGKEPEYLFMDVRDPDNARIVSAESAIHQDLSTRLLNPRWIKKTMDEGFAGGSLLAKSANSLLGWEITRESSISDADWERVTDVYVRDTHDLGLRQWFENENPHAFQDVTATLLETIRKDYWQAAPETALEIAAAYAESVARHGIGGGPQAGGNEKLETFVSEQLAAPGTPEMDALAEAYQKRAQEMTPPAPQAGAETVQGKKMDRTEETLEPQQDQHDEQQDEHKQDNYLLYLVATLAAGLLTLGFFKDSILGKSA